jgi:hypothetical protein
MARKGGEKIEEPNTGFRIGGTIDRPVGTKNAVVQGSEILDAR